MKSCDCIFPFIFVFFFGFIVNIKFHTLKLELMVLCSWYRTVFNKGWCVVCMPHSCNFQMQWNLCCILQNALSWTSQWYSYGWWLLGHLHVLHFGQILLLMRKLMSVIMNYHQRFLYTSLFSILNAILIHMCLNSWFGPLVYEIGYQIKVSRSASHFILVNTQSKPKYVAALYSTLITLLKIWLKILTIRN